MNTTLLAKTLVARGGFEKKGEAWERKGDIGLTIFATIGNEALSVGSVEKVAFDDDLVLIDTKKGDTYAIVAQDIRALRFGETGEKRRTGYHS